MLGSGMHYNPLNIKFYLTIYNITFINNLKLWKKQHEILWNYEQLEIISTEIEKVYHNCEDKDLLKKFINVILAQKKFLTRLYKE